MSIEWKDMKVLIVFFSILMVACLVVAIRIRPNLNSTSRTETSGSAERNWGVLSARNGKPDDLAPKLELLSMRWVEGHDHYFVRGEVKNISLEPLENVMAEVIFRDKTGDLVSHRSTLIELNPILPGQTSPYEVIEEIEPGISNCDLTFIKMSGGRIEFKDSIHPKKRKG